MAMKIVKDVCVYVGARVTSWDIKHFSRQKIKSRNSVLS